MQGGCSIPVFGYAQYDGTFITLKGGIISLDGQRIVKAKGTASPDDVKELGESVALEVLQQGGAEILQQIRSAEMAAPVNR
jgi:hydroxymethylbilane synthase